MKKLFFLAIGAVMFVACDQKKGPSAEELAAQQKIDSLEAIIAGQDAQQAEFDELIDQVNEGFRLMKEAEGRVDIKDGNIEGSRKQLIEENMKFIENQMNQNRQIIEQLKRKLQSSNGNVKSLAKQVEMLESQLEEHRLRIKELEIQLAERDVVIAEQGQQIENLNENVTELTNQNEQKAATVAQQDKDLNTAWFVFGTKSELKEQKILDKGDVLQNAGFNKGYFTQIDIRYDKDIRLYSKKAELLTNHPSGSYQLVKDAKGEYELHITNPTQFWSVSKYLVVQVK